MSCQMSFNKLLNFFFKFNKGFNDFSADWIRFADYTSFDYRRMLHKRGFNFKRPDTFSGGLYNIIRSANKPKITVFITKSLVTGNIPASFKIGFILLRPAPDCLHHRRPARFNCQISLNISPYFLTLIIYYRGSNSG